MSINSRRSVLMITYQYAPAADGGVARQAQLLSERLAARGRRVGVVTARFPGSAPYERLGGVDVHRVWAVPRPGTFSATFLPSLARFLVLGGRSYEVWHAHQAFYNAAVALVIARMFGTRCVVKDASSGLHGDMARLGRIRWGGWVRRALARADAVVSLSSEMTGELVGAGIPPARIRAIPNGVDCEQFAPPLPGQREDARRQLSISMDELVVLYAGRLAEDTGTSFMLDAWRILEARFPEKHWTLIVAGDELVGDTHRARGERELRRAKFVGKVPDVRPLLRAADILVRPSLNEGMSNVVLEGMASGLPVVATRTGGLKEQIQDGLTGVLVPPARADALADAIAGLAQDEAGRARMGSHGRIRARQEYSVPTIVDAYEALYDSFI